MKINFNLRPNFKYIIWFLLGFIFSITISNAHAYEIGKLSNKTIDEDYIYSSFSKDENFDISKYKNIVCTYSKNWTVDSNNFRCYAFTDYDVENFHYVFNGFYIKGYKDIEYDYYYMNYSNVNSPTIEHVNYVHESDTTNIKNWLGVSVPGVYYFNFSPENFTDTWKARNVLDFSDFMDKTLISINIYDSNNTLINTKLCKVSDFENGQFCGLSFDSTKASNMLVSYHLNNYDTIYSIEEGKYYSIYYSIINSLYENRVLSYSLNFYDSNNMYNTYEIKKWSSVATNNDELSNVRVVFGSGVNINNISDFTIKYKLTNNIGSVYFKKDFELVEDTNFNDTNIGDSLMNDNITNINNNITNSNVDGAQNIANDFFNNFSDNDFGLSRIVKVPLTLVNQITSKTCQVINLNLPYVDKTLTLPCMSEIYEEYFGSLYSIYQMVTFGFISYYVCVNVFRIVKEMKDPNIDKIEVLDL